MWPLPIDARHSDVEVEPNYPLFQQVTLGAGYGGHGASVGTSAVGVAARFIGSDD
jgi:hypothetical protein